MEDFLDDFFKAIKYICILFIILFCLLGISTLGHNCMAENITYIENGIVVDAIEYQNNIYLKKGD